MWFHSFIFTQGFFLSSCCGNPSSASVSVLQVNQLSIYPSAHHGIRQAIHEWFGDNFSRSPRSGGSLIGELKQFVTCRTSTVIPIFSSHILPSASRFFCRVTIPFSATSSICHPHCPMMLSLCFLSVQISSLYRYLGNQEIKSKEKTGTWELLFKPLSQCLPHVFLFFILFVIPLCFPRPDVVLCAVKGTSVFNPSLLSMPALEPLSHTIFGHVNLWPCCCRSIQLLTVSIREMVRLCRNVLSLHL